MPEVRELPTGTVTFFFSDVEGSTRLLMALGERYAEAHAAHQRIVREAFAAFDGIEISTEGDSFFAVFLSAADAVGAAAAAQRALHAHRWPEGGEVRVRMGLHTGQAVLVGDDYVGIDVNRAARIAAAGHGGQVLISSVTQELASGHVGDGSAFRDLGRHRLKDVGAEHLWQLDIQGLPSTFGALRGQEAVPSNLPAATTDLIDREEERAALGDMLESARLVTVTGPGGIGKTALALQVARERTTRFTDGVAYLDLAGIEAIDVMATELARPLGLSLDPSRPAIEEVLRALGDRDVLLVLDTGDHLKDLPRAVGRMVGDCRGTRVLVTSRSPLHVAGEQELPVRALDRMAATELFTVRAGSVRPGFALSEQNRAAVEAICERLDGLPLAIELAAARTRVLTPQAIQMRLTKRLPFLTGGARDAPDRHRTLVATIAWSYEALEPDEQRMLQRLAVFAGSFDLRAVEALGVDPAAGPPLGDPLAMLERLIDASLVSTVEAGDEPRFRLLATIREFAFDALEAAGSLDAVRDGHARYWLATATEAMPRVDGPDSVTEVARMRRDIEEYRAVLEWTLAEPSRVPLAIDLVSCLGAFWYRGGQAREGAVWAERALRNTEELPGVVPDAVLARALYWTGVLWDEQREDDRATKCLDAALDLQRRLHDEPGEARTLNSLGVVALMQKRYDRAEELLRDALERRRRMGDLRGVSAGLSNLGVLAFSKGRYEEAVRSFEESMEADRAAGVEVEPTSLLNLGAVFIRTGKLAEGVELVRRSINAFAELEDDVTVAQALERLAEAAFKSGDHQRALRLLGAAAAITDREGLAPDSEPELLKRMEADASVALGPERAAAITAEGRALDVASAVAYALSEG